MSVHQVLSTPAPTLNAADLDIIRAMIKVAVDDALHVEQDGLVDPRHFARVQVTMDDGSQMRGLVYPVERV